MADGNIVSSSVPEEFTKVRGEIAESRGDVTLIRASGEEVVVEKGSKIFLNDILNSHDNSAVVIFFENGGALTLGQDQQLPLTKPFFDRLESLKEEGSLEEAVSVEALEQAIAEGRSLEEILQAPAAGGDTPNLDGTSSSVIFYQRTGDSLLPVSGFQTSTFSSDTNLVINEFGDLDSNNQLNATNDPPVALASAATTSENTLVTGNVSATDSDGTVVSFSLDTDVPTGSLTFNPDGSYTFDPGTDFNSLGEGETQDITFTYTATDNDGNVSEPATVTITVTGVNDDPVAEDDAATTAEDTPLVSTIDLDANDTDVDGDTLSVTPGTFSTTQGGTIVIAADGSYTYTPAANFNGTDTVDYTVVDGNGGSDTGTLTVTVTAVNDAPVAVDDSASTAEDTPLVSTVDLDANDTDVDGDALTVTPGTFATTQGGSITIAADGSYTYTPAAGFNGTDTVDYTVTDGALTDIGTLTISVGAVNDAPVAVDDTATTAEDTPLVSTVDLDANDIDVDGDALTVTPGTFATAEGGSITIAADGSYTYTPATNFNGTDTVDYTVVDGNGGSDTGTLTITVTAVNDAPVAVDDVASTLVNTPVNNINVLVNDSDVDNLNSELTVSSPVLTDPTQGVVSVNADGSLNFTPATGVVGPVEITYTLTDPGGLSDTATLTVNVTSNGVPTVTIPNDDTIGANTDDIVVAEDGTTSGSFTVSAPDGLVSVQIGGSTISAAALAGASVATPVDVTGETNGTLQITGYDAGTGVISYTYDPTGTSTDHTGAPNDSVTESLAIVVNDSAGNTGTGTLDIGITDTAPTAAADTRTVSEDDLSSTGNVITGVNASADTLGADATTVVGVAVGDAGGIAVSGNVGSVVSGTYGDLTIGSDGAYTYATNAAAQALNAGDSVTDTFSYTIEDSDGDSSTVTVTLTVTGASEGVPTVTIPNDDTIGANTDDIVVAEDGTTSGSFTVSAPDGLVSVQIGGSTISAAALAGASVATPVDVTGETNGTLQITGYDAGTGVISYTYDPTGTSTDHTGAPNDSVTESLAIVVNDSAGNTGTGTLDIGITDTAPTAAADTRTVSEDDLSSTGNVITGVNASADTLGADATTVVGVAVGDAGGIAVSGNVGSVVSGTYGDLTIGADGAYTYATNAAAQALNAGDSVTDTFSYTIEDSDGDSSTVTVTLTVTGASEGVPTVTIPNDDTIGANTDDIVVAEDGTTSGSFTVSAPDGLVSVQIGGSTISAAALAGASVATPVDVTGETNGTLQITGYDAGTGVISYTYDPTGTSTDHTGAPNDSVTESLAIVVNDSAGNTGTGTLDIGITDTAPTAAADTRTVSEDDLSSTGNVITGVNASADTLGADATTVVGVAVGDAGGIAVSGNVGSVVSGTYGDLTIGSDGAYTYATNAAAQALNAGDSVTDTFSYTIEDSDGDSSTVTVTLTVTGASEGVPTVTIPNDDTIGANTDDIVVAEDGTTSGSFTVSAPDGLVSVQIGGSTISAAALAGASVATPVDVTGETNGTLQITGYDAGTGVISYTYDPTGTSTDHTGAPNDSVTESLAIVVNDSAGNTGTGTLDIGITDTAPTAAADTRTVSEDDLSSTGNVITGVNASADTLGADATTVVGVAVGDAGGIAVSGNVGSVVSGTYGDLTIGSDGAYTYATNAAAQALNAGDSVTDTFSYTIEDSDGDSSTETVTLTISGTNDAPVVTTTDSDVSSTLVTESFEFTGPDYVTPPGFDETAANPMIPENLTVTQESNVTVTFESSAAGGGVNNTFGYYEVAADGTISNTSIIWANTTEGAPPDMRTEGETATFSVSEGNQVGFFLLQDGADLYSGILADLDAGIGFIRFEQPTADGLMGTGVPATASDTVAPVLVYYPGDETSPGTPVPLLGQDFPFDPGVPQPPVHSNYSNLNGDGLNHTASGLTAGDTNSLTVSFEDFVAPLPAFPTVGVDWDLVDLVITVEIESVGLNLTEIDPILVDITDVDSTDLSSATVRIVTGRDTDELFINSATQDLLTLYGITDSYDDVTNALTLTGDATIAQYEEVLSAIQLSTVDPLDPSSDPREIEFTATDAEGATSLLATASFNADPTYDFSGDDFIAGDSGDNALSGLGGDDIIFGGGGSDTLSGGTGSNTFVWDAGDADGSTDTITDFTTGSGGDVLDFSDLLQGETEATIDDFLTATTVGTDTVITVDVDGVGADTDLTIVLEGVDLSAVGDSSAILAQLISTDNLNVDNP